MILFVSLPKLSCVFFKFNTIHKVWLKSESDTPYLCGTCTCTVCIIYLKTSVKHYSDEKGTRVNADRVLKNVIDV